MNIEKQIEKLEKELKELKEVCKKVKEEDEFKVGDWVCSKDFPDRYIGKISKIVGDRVYYNGNDFKRYIRIATFNEIEKHLINEAWKRGYKRGIRIDISQVINKNCPLPYIMNNTPIKCQEEYGDKYGLRMGGACIYANGKWATIIKEPELTFGGKKVKLRAFQDDEKTKIEIQCEGETEWYSELKKWKESFNTAFYYTFGRELVAFGNDKISLKYYPQLPISFGCVSGTLGEIDRIIAECEKLINE